MIAEKKLETLEKSAAKLTITVDSESAQKEYDEVVAKYRKNARVKGFRQGKVPTQVLENKFGPSLRSEAEMSIIENSLKEAFEDVEKKPLQFEPPALEDEVELSLGKDFTFTVTYDVFPEIVLGEYKGLSIEESSVTVGAEDVNRELEQIQDQNSVVTDKATPTVEKGDIVTINFVELDEGDNEITSTARQDFVFTVGSGYNKYRIDEELIGMNKDEEKVISKEYPEDFEEKDIAGKSVKLRVKATQVKIKQLPELDDELAQDVSDEFKTLDDLKKDIRKKLREAANERIRQQNIQKILDKIGENSTIVLPESMVKAELSSSWRNFVARSGLSESQVLQVLEQQNRSRDTLMSEWREGAENSIRTRLLMDKIIEQETIKVEDDELEKEIADQAERSGMSVEEAQENLKRNSMLDYLRGQLADRKLYDFLLAQTSKTKGTKVKFVELMQGS